MEELGFVDAPLRCVRIDIEGAGLPEHAVGLRRAIAAPIKHKKHTSDVLKCLGRSFPFELAHVKRVKRELNSQPAKLHVVLFIEQVHSEQFERVIERNCEIALSRVDPSLCCIEEFLGDLYVARLPTKPPLTRKQFDFTKKFWPVSFHEDKHRENMISGACYDGEEVRNANKFLNLAVECGKTAGSNNFGCSPGAVVVDPRINKIICKVSTSEVNRILLHGPMIAIDLLARHQGGGTYKELSGMEGLYCSDEVEGDYYIGTNMHVYLSHEPCVMCSMALLHSRACRVVYARESSQGGLGTLYKIHSHKDMNHKFSVYKLRR